MNRSHRSTLLTTKVFRRRKTYLKSPIKTSLLRHPLSTLSLSLMVSILSIGQAHATNHNHAFNANTPFNSDAFYTKDNLFDIESSEIELPELGSNGNRFIESNTHQALGEWSIQRINGSAPLLQDPWSQEVLERLAWQINAQARTKAPLALAVINNPSINAFAIPGGVMGINTGTVIEAGSMDEVASVVAHEVAHLSQRHYEHREDSDKKAMMLQIGGMLAALAASSADSDAAAAIIMGSQTAALNSQMAFSRSNEREADRIGMQLMAKSGYDPRAMPRFFANLNQKAQLNTSKQLYLPSFIMSHPLSSERLSEAQSRANHYDVIGMNEQHSQVVFDLLNWRLKVLTQQAKKADLVSAAPRSQGAKLALAHWYGTQGEYDEAHHILNEMRATNDSGSKSSNNSSSKSSNNSSSKSSNNRDIDLLIAITESQVAGMQGKWGHAASVLQPYSQLYPERRDIKIYLSDALLQLGKYKETIALLKPILESRPSDISVASNLQHAYELMAKQSDDALAKIATIHTLRYRSQAEMWQARYNAALISLQQAKSTAEALDNDNSTNGSTTSQKVNAKPLLALIDSDIKRVKMARDFEP